MSDGQYWETFQANGPRVEMRVVLTIEVLISDTEKTGVGIMFGVTVLLGCFKESWGKKYGYQLWAILGSADIEISRALNVK